LNQDLQKDRIIHREGWERKIATLFKWFSLINLHMSLLHKPIDSRNTHKFSKIIEVQTKTT
jgi:hypothetical protein